MENLIASTSAELIEILATRYEKGKSTIYKRLEFLKIELKKENGIYSIPPEKNQLLDELHQHLLNGGKMEDFELPGELATTTINEMVETDEHIQVEAIPTAEEGHQMRQLIRSSQEKAAGILIAQNMLTAQFKDNPELLDSDLWEQVKATEEAITPKSLDPRKYALSLVQKIGRGGEGESGRGEIQGFKTAIASYNGSIKQTLTTIAEQLQIPTETEEGKGMTADALKKEIMLNCNHTTLIVVDNAHRWSASLRYWLEGLQAKGVVLLLLSLDDLRKDVFLKPLKITLSPPTDGQIREIMVREAVTHNLDLSPGNMAYLQSLAGNNLMLAKKVIREAALGLHKKEGEHTQYVNIAPFVNAGLTCLGIVRFVGLGMGDRSLYIFGGIAMLLAISLRYLGQGFNQKQRSLGR